MTLTIGSLMYSPSASFMSAASIAGVLPTAGMSLISGVVMRPSGRTWTFADNSGLRHTKILSVSSGPMTYSSLGACLLATKAAGGSSGRFPPPVMHPDSVVAPSALAKIAFEKPDRIVKPPSRIRLRRRVHPARGYAQARLWKEEVKIAFRNWYLECSPTPRPAQGWPRKFTGLAVRP